MHDSGNTKCSNGEFISRSIWLRGLFTRVKWYHFLAFPTLFATLMATYGFFRPEWEQFFTIAPWASIFIALAIMIPMFILWTFTLKDEPEKPRT